MNVLNKYKNGHYSNGVTHFISVTLKDEIQQLPPITFIKKLYQKSECHCPLRTLTMVLLQIKQTKKSWLQ